MKITAKTLFGLENILAEELRSLGAYDVRPVNRAVLFTGGLDILYKVNYNSRFALSFLVSVDEFRINSKDDLYARALKIDWSGIMDSETTFSVVSVVNSRLFGHTAFPGLVVKDAIADHFRKRYGRRPSVNTSDPDIVVNLHISNENVNISIDSSVVPLYRRGYRKSQGPAPLNEVLAAGIVKLSAWDASYPLIDPMCGSGTIPVEAGLMALNIPPGRFRRSFGFTKWKNYDKDLLGKVRSESDSKVRAGKLNIAASDISAQAVAQAEQNIVSAGLSEVISLSVADFRDLKASTAPGWLIFNPPYGERIKLFDIEDLYSMTGTAMKHNFPGYRAWILTQGRELLKHIGLKPRSKTRLYNGPIECILAGYELYEGSRKKTTD